MLITHSTITDPYDFHIEGSFLTIEFYAYGPPLSLSRIVSCCRKAFVECKKHGGLDRPASDEPMGTDIRIYKSVDTYLYLHPGEDMTWGVLCDFEQDMRRFQSYILDIPSQTSFILLKEGLEGDIGSGIISM